MKRLTQGLVIAGALLLGAGNLGAIVAASGDRWMDPWHNSKYGRSSAIEEARVKAITSLRQAIADLKRQEPVAWLSRRYVDNFPAEGHETAQPTDYGAFPVYTHPQPKREPLTFEQVEDCFPEGASVFEDAYGDNHTSPRWLHAFARAIEAAHGIKGEA